jgi:transposase
METLARHRSPQHRVQAPGGRRTTWLARRSIASARRHDLSRNLIRIWIQKFEGGAFNDEAAAVDTIEAYEARTTALSTGRPWDRVPKGALKHGPRPRRAITSPNLAKDMIPGRPNQLWVADITYVPDWDLSARQSSAISTHRPGGLGHACRSHGMAEGTSGSYAPAGESGIGAA